MKKLLVALIMTILIPAYVQAYPSVFPTGVTIYKPDKCYNGYTIINVMRATPHGLPLIDMNGNVVNKWMQVEGQPAKLLPNGHLLAELVYYKPENWTSRQTEGAAVVEMDWQGKVVWQWDKGQKSKATPEMTIQGEFWSAMQHHDLQREGNPVGYFTPALDYKPDGLTMIQCGRVVNGKDTSALVIVDKAGDIVWEWTYQGHEEDLKKRKIPDFQNCASWLGPNKWFDGGDERFHPDNIIMDDGQEIIYIIDRKSGEVVWQVGPDYSNAKPLQSLGMKLPVGGYRGLFAGGMLHHAHMIPKGLPGEGNILVFNNGLPYSEVVEFDPKTLAKVWEYSGMAIGYGPTHSLAHSFFSATVSSAQRLPNGNTLICEGDGGRVFEVTRDLEIVWEWIAPNYWYGQVSGFTAAELQRQDKRALPTNSIYRAYRYPYEYVMQVPKPKETAVIPPSQFIADDSIKAAMQPKEDTRGDQPSPMKRY